MRNELDELLASLPAAADQARFDAYCLYTNLEIDAVRYEAATLMAQRALDLAREAFGLRSAQYARALQHMAMTDTFAERREAAVRNASEGLALTLATSADSRVSAAVISARVIKSRALALDGQVNRAARELETVLVDVNRIYGPESRMLGFHQQNLVSMLIRSGRLVDAVERGRNALQMLKRFAAADSFTVAAAENALANALLASRRGAEAVPLYEAVLPKALKIFGPKHRNYFEAVANLAAARAQSGDLSRALQELATLNALMSQAPQVRSSRVELVSGTIARLAGRPTDAITHLQRALGSGSTFRDPWERAGVDVEIALARESAGDTDVPEILSKALDTLTASDHMSTPTRADALLALSRARWRQGRRPEALMLARDAVGIWEKVSPNGKDEMVAIAWQRRIEAVP
jgi:hypothetical protein